MKSTWFETLEWAAKRGRAFSTTDLALELEVDPELVPPNLVESRVKAYAHGITQKLWKWGYIRKIVPNKARELSDKKKEKLASQKKKAGRGRPPAWWIVTGKGVWRSKQPYKRKYFFGQKQENES